MLNEVPGYWKPSRAVRSRLLGWWYVSIGAGFILLAVNRLIVGDAPWLIAIRFVIAAGFLVLGYLELKHHASSSGR
jgi:hypothetical protein